MPEAPGRCRRVLAEETHGCVVPRDHPLAACVAAWVDVLGTAQRALRGGFRGRSRRRRPRRRGTPLRRARAWLAEAGWQVHPHDPVIDDLDTAWAACDAAGLGLDEAR
ncbi:hypothetical protein [Janibacter sp. G368]|uniref:hypothetical protein n=1 Tax=Janibacter sp. G368 TaxID=3420441 RepID=UPI003D0447D7